MTDDVEVEYGIIGLEYARRREEMNKKLLIMALSAVLITGCSANAPLETSAESNAENEISTEVDNEATGQETAQTETTQTETAQTETAQTESTTEVTIGTSILADENKKFLITNDLNNVDLDRVDSYEIYAKFDPVNKLIHSSQKVRYVNKEDVDLNQVLFQILPNAYKSLDTAPVLFGDIDSIYPNGFEPGYIEFTKVLLNGQEADYVIEGSDETLLRIGLPEALKIGRNVEVEMEYTVKIPPAYDRFGYNESTFNIANWYPVAAVYDEEGWHEDGYLAVGDPFYTDIANYSVVYDVPESFEVASTGVRSKVDLEDGRKQITYNAELVRDTAWISSEDWNIHSEEVDGTTVRSYYFGEVSFAQEKAFDAARSSIEIFNDLFGPYPYSELAVVATDFPSGMEYPSMVMIAKDRYRSARMNALESVIAHEIGHQWWYGVVGNDQVGEAWLDESLTVFSTAMYFGEKYGEQAYNNYVASYRKTYESRKNGDGDGIVVKNLNDFESWTDYSNLVYRKGMLFIDELKTTYGIEATLAFLQDHYKENKFKIANTDKLLKLGERHFDERFNDIVNEWLYNGTGIPEQE